MAIDWRRIPDDQAGAVLAGLKPHVPLLTVPTKCALRVAKLPFYESYLFYEISNQSGETAAPAYVLTPETGEDRPSVIVDGTPPPIDLINEFAPIKLTADNVSAYLSYYFTCTQRVYEGVAIIDAMPELAVNDAQQKTLRELQRLIPPRVFVDRGGTEYVVEAPLQVEENVWLGRIRVTATGVIDIIDRRLKLGPLAKPPGSSDVHVHSPADIDNLMGLDDWGGDLKSPFDKRRPRTSGPTRKNRLAGNGKPRTDA